MNATMSFSNLFLFQSHDFEYIPKIHKYKAEQKHHLQYDLDTSGGHLSTPTVCTSDSADCSHTCLTILSFLDCLLRSYHTLRPLHVTFTKCLISVKLFNSITSRVLNLQF
jgi:hypothetical protein